MLRLGASQHHGLDPPIGRYVRCAQHSLVGLAVMDQKLYVLRQRLFSTPLQFSGLSLLFFHLFLFSVHPLSFFSSSHSFSSTFSSLSFLPFSLPFFFIISPVFPVPSHSLHYSSLFPFLLPVSCHSLSAFFPSFPSCFFFFVCFLFIPPLYEPFSPVTPSIFACARDYRN